MTLYRRYIGNSLIPYSLWEDVVDVDGEEDGTHRASLTQSSLQLHYVNDSPTRICITEREYIVSMKEYVLPVTP